MGEKKFIKKKIHIIAGGGTGAYLFNILHADGHYISTCILSSIDTDSKIAEQLGIPLVHEEPFVNISRENKRKSKELIADSDVIIVARVPIGNGNFFNLKMVEDAILSKKEVYFLDGKNFFTRDFTNGEATSFYQRMIKMGAKSIKNEEEMALLLRESRSLVSL